MNKHLDKLIELSKYDVELDSYTPQLEAADKKIEKIQMKLDFAQSDLDALTSEIDGNSEKVKSFEEQLAMLNEQLTLNAKKAKDISTEKEMKALSLEEEIAKEKMTFANEEINRLQGINDTKSELLAEASEKIGVLKEEFDGINKEVTNEKQTIQKSKDKLFKKREEASRVVEQKVLIFYEKIRSWAGNSALVPVKKQACYGCYMKINDKAYSEIIKGDSISNCPHCGRILYVESITAEA